MLGLSPDGQIETLSAVAIITDKLKVALQDGFYKLEAALGCHSKITDNFL